MTDRLETHLTELAILEGEFLGTSMRVLESYRTSLRLSDFLAWGALRRGLFLVAGFRQMITDRNLVCAGALLRVQLDTALRFQSVFLVDDAERFAGEVISGTPIKNLKARTGEALTDRFLMDSAAVEFPWVAQIYPEASGFIHFSEKHLLSSQSPTENSRGRVVSVVDSYDEVPDGTFEEAAQAFKKSANLLETYVTRWNEA